MDVVEDDWVHRPAASLLSIISPPGITTSPFRDSANARGF
jgi:hypothetical protein